MELSTIAPRRQSNAGGGARARSGPSVTDTDTATPNATSAQIILLLRDASLDAIDTLALRIAQQTSTTLALMAGSSTSAAALSSSLLTTAPAAPTHDPSGPLAPGLQRLFALRHELEYLPVARPDEEVHSLTAAATASSASANATPFSATSTTPQPLSSQGAAAHSLDTIAEEADTELATALTELLARVTALLDAEDPAAQLALLEHSDLSQGVPLSARRASAAAAAAASVALASSTVTGTAITESTSSPPVAATTLRHGNAFRHSHLSDHSMMSSDLSSALGYSAPPSFCEEGAPPSYDAFHHEMQPTPAAAAAKSAAQVAATNNLSGSEARLDELDSLLSIVERVQRRGRLDDQAVTLTAEQRSRLTNAAVEGQIARLNNRGRLEGQRAVSAVASRDGLMDLIARVSAPERSLEDQRAHMSERTVRNIDLARIAHLVERVALHGRFLDQDWKPRRLVELDMLADQLTRMDDRDEPMTAQRYTMSADKERALFFSNVAHRASRLERHRMDDQSAEHPKDRKERAFGELEAALDRMWATNARGLDLQRWVEQRN
ncbi:hypothetical protein BC828DRAFT_387205 [Blastocladiella britannica]|nr:hypothetical protein BC828DRAFT_387205 [Blastocladiella britannica]